MLDAGALVRERYVAAGTDAEGGEVDSALTDRAVVNGISDGGIENGQLEVGGSDEEVSLGAFLISFIFLCWVFGGILGFNFCVSFLSYCW